MAILFGRNQPAAVVSYLICGLILAFFFDVLKIKRIFFGSCALLLFLDDFLFCTVSAAVIIINAYAMNDGNMKWYELPFLCIGFWIWRKTLSRFFINTFVFINRFLKNLIFCILRPLKCFIRALCSSLRNIIAKLYYSAVTASAKRRFCGMKI